MMNFVISRAHMYAHIMVLIVAILILGGCDTDLVDTGYKVAKSAETTYNAAVATVQDMDSRGQLSEERKAEITQIAEKYYDGVMVLKKALLAYKSALQSDEEGKVKTAEIALRAALKFVQDCEPEIVSFIGG